MEFAEARATGLASPPEVDSPRTTILTFTQPRLPHLPAAFKSTPFIFALLTTATVLIHGYHPYAEDAGIYVAGIELGLNSQLFPYGRDFVTAHTSWSIFAPFLAATARATRLPLPYVLFGVQVASTWMLLFSCWQIARRCFRRPSESWASVLLVACCLTLPVAGTSLFMMDPYVTGRSFSTPCILLAISGCLERRWAQTLIPLGIAALFHPLMAIYAGGFLLMLMAAQRSRWIWAAVLCFIGVAAGAALQISQRGVEETPAYIAAALTRTYFYLSEWQWYEIVGILAPPAMMVAYAVWRNRRPMPPHVRSRVALCWAMVLFGGTAILVSLLFSHPLSHSHLVARLQPLRAFHIIYLVFFLLLGGLMGQYWLNKFVWRWFALFGAVAAIMFLAQRAIYPASPHIEAPWTRDGNGSRSSNPWTEAFLWVRANTPVDAVFALDANYITGPGEDAQGFRAEAERSSLADYSKDGGASAIFPQLAPAWMAQHTADNRLSSATDQQRVERLAPFGVTWIILRKSAQTGFDCPYANAEIRACRLPAFAPRP